MKIIISFLILFLPVCVYTQDSYAKFFDLRGERQEARQIIAHDGAFYIAYHNPCNVDDYYVNCAGVLKIDQYGNVLDSTFINNMNTNYSSLSINKNTNTLLYAGIYRNDSSTAFKYITFPTYDLSKRLTSWYPDSVSMLHPFSETKNNSYFISATKRVSSAPNPILLIKLDENLNEEKTVDLQAGKHSNLRHLYTDVNDRLTAVLNYTGEGPKRYVNVQKYDNDLNPVWEWKYEMDFITDDDIVCELKDGKIILNKEDDRRKHLVCIDVEKNVDWEFKFERDFKKRRHIKGLAALNNGDLLILGTYSHMGVYIDDVEIREVPWMARFSSDGKLRWEKAYYTTSTYYWLPDFSLRDVTELENGDLLAVGHVYNRSSEREQDILVLRTTADGCMHGNCDAYVRMDLSNSTKDQVAENAPYLYPVPTRSELNIRNPQEVAKIAIYDTLGKRVYTSEEIGALLILPVPSGRYVAKIVLKEGGTIQQKIVITK